MNADINKCRQFSSNYSKMNSDVSNQYTLNINGKQVTLEKSVKLLSFHIDNKLSFDEHVS